MGCQSVGIEICLRHGLSDDGNMMDLVIWKDLLLEKGLVNMHV